MMRVGQARTVASEWVMSYASNEAGFYGAYFSGSTVGLPDDALLDKSSDVDIMLITTKEEPPLKQGKFIYKGALLEASYVSLQDLASAEEVLGNYHLAGSLRLDSIITDPTGDLKKLQKEVAHHFYEQKWVRKRYENALARVENGLRGIDASSPLHNQVMGYLFPTGVTTHVILVAALKNPTIRLRYLRAREVLIEYGYEDVYTELLELTGWAHLTPERVEYHVNALSKTFDATANIAKTPFFFSSDITTAARPISIDGSRELIRSGNHHEAVFWIIATFARCHAVLSADATEELQRKLMPSFDEILADIGIRSTTDLIERAEKTLKYIPRLVKIAEEILFINPEITGE